MQRASKGIFGVLAVTLAALAGCNIINPQSNQPPAPVSTTYEYWVTGGFAGSREHTVIDSTGFVQYTEEQGSDHTITTYIYRMGSGEFDTLKNAFVAADFASLEDSYSTSPRIMDGFNMKVTLNANSISRTVSIEAGAPVPERLSALLGVLIRLTTTVQSNGQKL